MQYPVRFQQGVDEFNSGQFYACHDTLEAIWMEAETIEKPFYQGILQIAVAFYHLGNLNWRGGAILLGEGVNRLRRFEPVHESVDVETLVDQATEWLTLVQASGEAGLSSLMEAPPVAFPQIHFVKRSRQDLRYE
jgi:predicted metal-dependent hydrolase